MPRPLFLFAPGAGAPSSHPWMRDWAEKLGPIGEVRMLDYPYLLAGSRRPDPLRTLVASHRAAVQATKAGYEGPIVLIGKSMGGRIGCHVSLEEEVTALICLGYPLCGGGDPEKLRDKVLREITTPVLFVQGTRDKLCPLELLEPIRREMKARNALHVVENGDHSLQVTRTALRAAGETQDDVDERVLGAIRQFVAEHAGVGDAAL